MGYGAFMKVTNNRDEAMKTYVTDVNCMYQNGGDGSHLEYFNDRTIQANSSYPTSGHGEYIEAKNSGSCFFESARFKIKITNPDTGVNFGTLSFSDSSSNWNLTDNTNEDSIYVNIDNSGDQAVIAITLASSG